MRRFKLHKLVRDKIIDHVRKEAKSVVYRRLNNKEYVRELREKLKEEVAELQDSKPGKIQEELADIQEVINHLLSALEINKKKFSVTLKNKDKKSGGFKKKIFIETVDLEENDEWIPYYEKSFPEIKIR